MPFRPLTDYFKPHMMQATADKELGITGRREDDIELPNRSGKVDPRLKKPDPLRGLELAGKHLHQLREKGLFKKGTK